MFKKILLTTLIGHVHSAGYDYSQYGANWIDTSDPNNMCGGDHQSPINLRFDFEKASYKKDNIFKHYEDFTGAQIGWLGEKYSAKVNLPGAYAFGKVSDFKPNYFKADTLGLKATFYGAQFHFHSQSEHTINNVRYDFEMHTVHLPGTENTYVEGGLNKEEGYFGSVQGIIFDTKNYDESVTPEEVDIIDSFFDSLQMDQLVPNYNSGGSDSKSFEKKVTLGTVPYGKLMNMLATTKRFVYTGSLTTPPCTEKVFWNVAAKVYPMKTKHLQQFRHLMLQEMKYQTAGQEKIKQGGNYRVVQDIKKQAPVLVDIANDVEEVTDYERINNILLIVLIFIVVNLVIMIGLNYAIWQRNEDKQKEKEEQAKQNVKPFSQIMQESVEYAPVAMQGTPAQGKASAFQFPDGKGNPVQQARPVKSGAGETQMVKMSSGNFGSEMEDSMRDGKNTHIEKKMQGGGTINGEPSPSTVMREHSNSYRNKN